MNQSLHWKLGSSGIVASLALACLALVSGCGKSEPVKVSLGNSAPDFTFVDLADGNKSKLSDLKGKIVVLDFWASWCGPCQATMDHFQEYRAKHPEWGDKVVLLSVSIDEKEKLAKNHLKKKNWEQSRNSWVDAKGGRNPVVMAYAGKGIPAGFVVGADGKLVAAGHPDKIGVSKIVGELLSAKS